jgi:hypothetical protein
MWFNDEISKWKRQHRVRIETESSMDVSSNCRSAMYYKCFLTETFCSKWYLFSFCAHIKAYTFTVYPAERKNRECAHAHTHTHTHTLVYLPAWIFMQANLQVTYKTTNRIAKLLWTQPRHNKNDYENSAIYGLRCTTCHLTYIGQTGQNLKTCYSKHARYIRSNNLQPAYAQHILQQWHEYGPMQETMTLIHRTNKGRRMDTMEQLQIQKHHQEHQLIPEQKPHEYNPLFQLLYDTRAQLCNTWRSPAPA